MKTEFNKQTIFVGSGGVEWREGLPTFVLLHGAGLNRTVWVLLGRYFARHGYNVVIPDLPGHGASEGEPLVTIEDNASWVNSLVDHLAQSHPLANDNLIYCGHSMGSLVMLEAAASRVAQMDKLLLLGSSAPMVVGAPLLDAARNNEHAAIEMINMFGHGFGSRIGNNPVSGISAYNTMEALLEQADDGVLFADLNACNDYKNGDAAAKYLAGNAKVAVIAGDADRMTPAKLGAKLCSQLEGSYFLLKDCGHMMMSEQPETTLKAMKKALAG